MYLKNSEKFQITQIRNSGYTVPSSDQMMQTAIDTLVSKGIAQESQNDVGTIYVFTDEGKARFGR